MFRAWRKRRRTRADGGPAMTDPMQAAIEAATKALADTWGDHVFRLVKPQEFAEVAYAAIEPLVRKAVADQIAEAIKAQCGNCEKSDDPTLAAECEYLDAARIAREIGERA